MDKARKWICRLFCLFHIPTSTSVSLLPGPQERKMNMKAASRTNERNDHPPERPQGPTAEHSNEIQTHNPQELWDRALGLLLEREESLLYEIVEQCGDLVRTAEQQAWEMADLLDGDR